MHEALDPLGGFVSLPINRFPVEPGPEPVSGPAEGETAWRLALYVFDYGPDPAPDRDRVEYEEYFARFLAEVDTTRVKELVFGIWTSLENSVIQDEIAAAIASAPVVARLTELSLQMGTLSDVGAEALLSGRPLTDLESLNLTHNFLSEEMADRLVAALPEIVFGTDEREEPTAWRYIEVRE